MRRLFVWVLWNRAERRLRTPWRLLVGVVVLLLFSIAGLVLLRSALLAVGIEGLLTFGVPSTEPLVTTGFGGLITLAGVAALARYVDRRRFTDYGLRLTRNWWIDLGFGLLLGALLMTGLFAIGVAFGWFAVVGSVGFSAGFVPPLLLTLAVFAIVGVYEELLIRGYVLTNLAEGCRWFEFLGHRGAVLAATLLSSALFGVFHATNPSATLLSTLFITVAGVMLAAGYLFTGELAIPIGLHTTWNAFQGVVYGFPVSGLPTPVSFVETAPRGPTVISGGSFGPEAGLLGLFSMLLGIVAIAAYVRYRYDVLEIHPLLTTPILRDSGESPVESHRSDAVIGGNGED